MFEAVILAGGFGTRLQPVVKEVPKAMAPVNGRPFLEYLLNHLEASGIKKVVLSVGHRSEMIIDHFGSEYLGIKIDYAIENEPLGTGGGIRLALEKCSDKIVLAMNGDTMFAVDLKDFYKKHLEHKAMISIALRKVEDISRYGSVRTDKNNTVISFGEKSREVVPGLINAGIYLINRNYFLNSGLTGAFSIEKDCFEQWYQQGLIAGFPYDTYFLDIGIPEDYLKAQDEFAKLKY
jgi:D-glycero-alpha-D-manno-heptose 1-phosphate guanylyltransferase